MHRVNRLLKKLCRAAVALTPLRFELCLEKLNLKICDKSQTYETDDVTNAKGKCRCSCVLLIFAIFFVTFWSVIILYVSDKDKPLDIEVREDFPLPDIKPKFSDENSRVPLLFHQLWKSAEIPKKFESAHEGCVTLNHEYELILWTDEMIYNFIAREYPWFYCMFLNYPYQIQRVDVARYFILHHYGGVYLDLDAACKTPFRDILSNMTEHEEVLLPMTDIYGVTNSFMVAEPKSRFFTNVIYELQKFAQGGFNLIRHTAVIFSTGPMFMSHCVKTFNEAKTIHVVPLVDYNEKHFDHAKAGTWHNADTEIVDAFHFHYFKLLTIAVVVVVAILACYYRRCKSRTRHSSERRMRLETVQPTRV